MRSAMRIATYWSSARGPPALPRRWRPPTAAPASSCAMKQPSSAAACWPRPSASIDGLSAHAWVQQSHRLAREATIASPCSPAPPPSAISRTISSVSVERLSDHLAHPPARSAARAAMAGARALGGARHRRDRAAVGVSGQRSAGNPARGRRADLSESLRRARRHARGHRDRRRRCLPGGARSQGRRRRHCRRRGSARRGRRAPCPTPRAAQASTCCRVRPCSAPKAICASRPSPSGACRAARCKPGSASPAMRC